MHDGLAQRPVFHVVNQYVRDFSLENPGAPQSYALEGQPNLTIKVDVHARTKGTDHYETTLKLAITAKHQETTLFITELEYAGLFLIKHVPEEQLHPVLLVECPRLLFPFARAIIAQACTDAGYPPILLQPIDFNELFKQNATATKPVLAPSTETVN